MMYIFPPNQGTKYEVGGSIEDYGLTDTPPQYQPDDARYYQSLAPEEIMMPEDDEEDYGVVVGQLQERVDYLEGLINDSSNQQEQYPDPDSLYSYSDEFDKIENEANDNSPINPYKSMNSLSLYDVTKGFQGFNTINVPELDQSEGAVIVAAAERQGIPANILAGIYGAETAFGKQNKTSSAGAKGSFQFMGPTAKRFGVDVNSFESGAEGAAKYLKYLYGMFGNWEKAIAAYNAGEGTIQKRDKKGLPYPEETRKYVPKVLGYANQLNQE